MEASQGALKKNKEKYIHALLFTINYLFNNGSFSYGRCTGLVPRN